MKISASWNVGFHKSEYFHNSAYKYLILTNCCLYLFSAQFNFWMKLCWYFSPWYIRQQTHLWLAPRLGFYPAWWSVDWFKTFSLWCQHSIYVFHFHPGNAHLGLWFEYSLKIMILHWQVLVVGSDTFLKHWPLYENVLHKVVYIKQIMHRRWENDAVLYKLFRQSIYGWVSAKKPLHKSFAAILGLQITQNMIRYEKLHLLKALFTASFSWWEVMSGSVFKPSQERAEKWSIIWTTTKLKTKHYNKMIGKYDRKELWNG